MTEPLQEGAPRRPRMKSFTAEQQKNRTNIPWLKIIAVVVVIAIAIGLLMSWLS